AMEKIDLSIIIVNYNTKDFLKKCLESLQPAIGKTSFRTEIIIADNGSTDGSVEYLEEVKKNKDWQIKVIQNNENLGFAKANNLALKKAQGHYILFLNPDTIVQKETLKTMIKFMDENPKVGAATCRVELTDGQLDQACHRGFPTAWNAFCYFSGLEKLFPKSKIFAGYSLTFLPLDKIHEIDAGAGAFLIVRREAGEPLGWFDEDHFWYGEDLDFCYRLKQKGWKVMFVPTTKIIHWKGAASGIKKHSQKVSSASRQTKIKAAKASVKVMRIFFNKHYKNKYPRFTYWLVMLAIKLLEKIRLSRIK
ncbi:glycosyltransferase family 2 protein, partial [Patescibacteria group bacterium]|nr:glycosyltransferase family 2 protein [Patescibacteria group bacterium]